jgi:hypothetical protein
VSGQTGARIKAGHEKGQAAGSSIPAFAIPTCHCRAPLRALLRSPAIQGRPATLDARIKSGHDKNGTYSVFEFIVVAR